jgi:hypothetical protein
MQEKTGEAGRLGRKGRPTFPIRKITQPGSDTDSEVFFKALIRH